MRPINAIVWCHTSGEASLGSSTGGGAARKGGRGGGKSRLSIKVTWGSSRRGSFRSVCVFSTNTSGTAPPPPPHSRAQTSSIRQGVHKHVLISHKSGNLSCERLLRPSSCCSFGFFCQCEVTSMHFQICPSNNPPLIP